MPRITIDGKKCDFQEGQPILDVAQENGIEIPHYCYHPSLSVVANCRICLAEVWAPNPKKDNKLEPMPKLLPTCQTMATDGHVVYTSSPKATANQKAVMEYLLNHHPIDCPICDQAGECTLQDYAYEHGRGVRRCDVEKITQSKKDVGDHIMLYGDRCIMCTRCVRFTEEITGTSELYIDGRGVNECIDVFPGQGINNELSGNVIDLCPVGALLDKDFMFSQRVWLLKTTPSIDPITSSGDNIVIEHNHNKIYRIKPRANPEINQYWITDETRYGWKFVHDESRITFPAIKGESLAPEDPEYAWESALLAAVQGLKKASSVALLLSPNLSCEDAWLLGNAIKTINADVAIGLGPVPVSGEDKAFKSGFIVRSEKAPNARGVSRVIGDSLLDYESWKLVADKSEALVVTGNYPKSWDTPNVKANQFLVVLDTLKNKLSSSANVFLPVATWAEKSGTFENCDNVLQAFGRALMPIGQAQSEAQIGMNLHALADDTLSTVFNATTVRRRMADSGIRGMLEVVLPQEVNQADSDMTLSEV